MDSLLETHERTAEPVPARTRWQRCAIGVVLFLVALVLPLFRQAQTRSWDTVWAEDGSIYAQQAIRHGGLHVLFRGYAGYVQLVPRLLAIPTAWFSIRELALYCAVASVVVAALLAWFVYRMTAGWIASPVVRLTLASFIVLTPTLGPENTACIVNTIWILLAAAPFALISVQEGRSDTAIRAGVAFLAATSTVLCAFYLPLALAWVLIRRTRSAVVVAGALCVGLAVQAVATLAATGSARPPSRIALIRDGLALKVFAGLLVGPKWAADLWRYNWRLVVIGAPLAVFAILVGLSPRVRRRNQALSAVLVAYAVILFVVPAWGRGTNLLGLSEGHLGVDWESRFDVVPIILLGAAVAMLLTRQGGMTREWPRVIAVAVFAAQVVLLTVVNFSVVNVRSHDLAWKPKVARIYAAQCVGASPDKLVRIPNNKSLFFAVTLFPVTVPCRSLAP